MSDFIKASRMKLKIATNKGELRVEDLWDLNLTDLNSIAKSLRRLMKQDTEEDFLNETTSEDEVTKLKFDIVLHILNTMKEEKKQRELEVSKKVEKQKILGLIAQKEEESLGKLSVDDLKAKLAQLN